MKLFTLPYCLFLLFLYIPCLHAYAQNNIILPQKFEDYQSYANTDSLELFAFSQKKYPEIYLHALISVELSSTNKEHRFGKYLEEIKLLATQQSSDLGMAMYHTLCTYIYWKSDLAKATQSVLKALNYFEQKNDVSGMISCYYDLIAINLDEKGLKQANLKQAIAAYNKAIPLVKQTTNIRSKILGATLIINFTNLLYNQNDIEKELSAYRDIKHLIAENPKYSTALHALSVNMGMLMTRLKRDEEALPYFYEFIKYPKISCEETAKAHYLIGSCLIKLNRNKEGIRHLEKGLQLYEKCTLSWLDLYVDLYADMSVACFNLKKYDLSWEYRNKSDSLKMILQKNVNAEKAFDIQTKYESEKKELQNKALLLEMKQQNQSITFLVILIALLIISTGIGFWLNKKNTEKIENLMP